MDGFVRFQGEFQAAASLCHLAGAVHPVSLGGEPFWRTGGVGHGKGPGIRSGNGAADLFRHFQRELIRFRLFKIEGIENVQTERPALGEDPVTDVPGGRDAVHEAVALGKTVGGVQFLSSGRTAAVQRVL